MNPAVAKVFATYPPKLRQRLLAVRRMIFEVAKQTEGVGKLQETLKWGEPAYLTAETRAGSTIRLAWRESDPARIALLFHCQTNLVESFRERFAAELQFEGNRAVVLGVASALPRGNTRLLHRGSAQLPRDCGRAQTTLAGQRSQVVAGLALN